MNKSIKTTVETVNKRVEEVNEVIRKRYESLRLFSETVEEEEPESVEPQTETV